MAYYNSITASDWERLRKLYDRQTVVNRPSARYLGDGIYTYHEWFTPKEKKKELLDEDECI